MNLDISSQTDKVRQNIKVPLNVLNSYFHAKLLPMTQNQLPYTSEEIARLVHRWQQCQFFNLHTLEPIVSISNRDLFRKGSQTRCAADALKKIKLALSQAYEAGIREVGLFCPPETKIELIDLALTVTKDPEWKIHPRIDLAYFKNLLEIQENIWAEEMYLSEKEARLDEAQKVLLDDMGFTDEILDELREYENASSVDELPSHLRELFAEEEEDENKS